MKVGIVGCGHIASIHIPRILRYPKARIVGLCERNEARLRQACQIYGIKGGFRDLAQMVESASPDVVHILTPPQSHCRPAVQALEAGCHVFVEKPLCLTPTEADYIYAAARSADRLVGVDHTYLFDSLFQKARRVVESGRLGQVVNVQYALGDDFLEAVKGGHARWAMELRGGIFCDLIPHPLYLIRALLPTAQAVSARARGTAINDLSQLWVDFSADGAGAQLWLSLAQRPLEHSLRIYCERGTIHLDLRNFSVSVVGERGLPGPIARVTNSVSESWQKGIGPMASAIGLLLGRFDPYAGTTGAIHTFYDALIANRPSPVSYGEAKAVVDLSIAIWDFLEGAPGAIRQTVDEKDTLIVQHGPIALANNSGPPAKVLVTGGTGFIGGHLVRRLAGEGRRLRVLCRPHSRLDALPSQNIELAFGDVTDLQSIRQAMPGIETVYHLAATTGGDWGSYWEGTVVGTQNVLRVAGELGVGKVIYVSSMGVLQASSFRDNNSVDETFTTEGQPEARGDYSRAKIEAERIALQWAQETHIPLSIVRPGLVYGPGRPEFLSDVGFRAGSRVVLVVGMGNRRLGLTYVENLVDALLLADQGEVGHGDIYHIVDADQPTVTQYIRRYAECSGERLAVLYMPTIVWTAGFGLLDAALKLFRGSSSNLSYRLRSMSRGPRFDSSLANQRLGWRSQVPWEEAMKITYAGKPR